MYAKFFEINNTQAKRMRAESTLAVRQTAAAATIRTRRMYQRQCLSLRQRTRMRRNESVTVTTRVYTVHTVFGTHKRDQQYCCQCCFCLCRHLIFFVCRTIETLPTKTLVIYAFDRCTCVPSIHALSVPVQRKCPVIMPCKTIRCQSQAIASATSKASCASPSTKQKLHKLYLIRMAFGKMRDCVLCMRVYSVLKLKKKKTSKMNNIRSDSSKQTMNRVQSLKDNFNAMNWDNTILNEANQFEILVRMKCSAYLPKGNDNQSANSLKTIWKPFSLFDMFLYI